MSDPVYVTGTITITPPVTHAELAARPDLAARGTNYRQAWIEVSETVSDTPDGTLLRREGTGLRAYEGGESPWTLLEDLQEVATAFPDRVFSGYLECRSQDDGSKWRLVITDGKVAEVHPRVVWPGEPGYDEAGQAVPDA